jgi:hypothetical protein
MLRKILLSILTGLTFVSYAQGESSDYITYEWLINLGRETGYTDHITHWRRLFNTMKVRGFLECGCGYSTGYFLDNANLVISIEYINPGCGTEWYYKCLSIFSDKANWIPMTYNEDLRSNSFNNACAYQCSTHADYSLIDAVYLKELYKHFKTQIEMARSQGNQIDVAFVDPGVFIRGDMVKLLLSQKIPIVAAHDTASDNGTEETHNLYGWNKVSTPPDYVKIYVPFGQGITFWISEELPAVIQSMQAYRDNIIMLQALGIVVDYNTLTKIADYF